MKIYNCEGIELSPGELYTPLCRKFFDSNGSPKWSKWLKYSDENGFDVRYRNNNGVYIQKIFLPKGKRIVRYGREGGSFTTEKGEPFEKLSLPYEKFSMPYHEYIVSGEAIVDCIVDKGIAAPGFASGGGGIQYRHYISIRESLRQGILKEDFSWLKK